jgi:formylglycine-generating enzyme required for sulfatase activity
MLPGALILAVFWVWRSSLSQASTIPTTKEYTNGLGIKMVRIEPGKFLMGSDGPASNWDERPVHEVKINQAFYMSETEVTVEQFRRFRADFVGTEAFRPYAAGVSWYDATSFCRWLSENEGRTYRLATEAEWEYACRAGTTTAFWSGEGVPAVGAANAWGLKNMHSGVREWCLDWYGEYELCVVVDPVGPERGMVRVVRGGSLDKVRDEGTYARSSSRAGMAAGFGPYANNPNQFGYHNIGFRVVEGALAGGKASGYRAPFAMRGVKQNSEIAQIGPGPEKPYFRKRYMLATPPENCSREVIDSAGLHPGLRGHNHSPGFEVCDNGDLLLAIHTSYNEYEPGVAIMGCRLRFGCEQWDMPEILFDVPGAGDPAPMLWNDEGTLYFFCGHPRLENAFPFYWTSSTDNGATWSEFRFPEFMNKVGGHSRQPINTALRDKSGVMYVSSDGSGGTSVLWTSADNGKTWYDPVGRSGGRHTTFVLLRDGRILGMGGKNTNIAGFMPKSISCDGGKTWDVSKTGFAALGSNQRPSVLRLGSGRLLFAGDYQHINGSQPEGVTEKGSYVALSEDEGESWTVKKLIGTQRHENPDRHGGADTIGYSVARQAPNGMIHLITTMNRPCLHLAFNEAWILAKDTQYDQMGDGELMKPAVTKIRDVRTYKEKYPDGKVQIRWSGGVGDDARFLLHGSETWFYENGRKQRQVTYDKGRKTGTETYWTEDGGIKWMWEHKADGLSMWVQYWPNGNKKAESTWRDLKCDGVARRWSPSGELISRVKFADGRAVE